MSKPKKAAHFVVYGTTAETIEDTLSEHGVTRVTETMLDALDSHGDGFASENTLSASLVTGDRAEKLLDLDSNNW